MTKVLHPTISRALDWKLKAGSHTFPGPDGGTCINEAAIVAAGFEYRSVSSANDCPPCFSRPLSAYALGLNDAMPDETRQRLLTPFVVRLAGTADTPEIERQRVDYITLHTIRRIVSIAMRKAGLEQHAVALETAPDLPTALSRLGVARAAAAAARWAAAAEARWAAAAEARWAAAEAARWAAAEAEAAARWAAAAAAEARWAAAAAAEAAREEIWTIAAEILDGAMKIGRQPEALDVALVVERMDRARARDRALALGEA